MPPKKRGTYTAEEVATHNTSKSLWVIMNRKVYDVTMFHKRHPGGAAVILQMGGKDATAAATAAHKSILPGNLMWEFCIGSVVRAKRVEEAAPADSSPASKVTDAAPAPAALQQTAPLPRPVPKPSAKQTAKAPETSPRSGGAAEGRPKPAAKKPAAKAAAQSAASPPESQSAEQKKAQKEDAPKKKKSGNFEDDQNSSVCSRSVQGSDDMHDSLSDREHSPREGKEKSGVSAATDGLLEKIRAEPRLLRWSTRSDQQKLAYEVRRFISGALGTRTSTNIKSGSGDDHAVRCASTDSLVRKESTKSVRSEHKYSTKDLRVRVESHANEFIESLVEIVQQPHPLGEDVLVAAIAALNRDESRVSLFLEHIRVRNKHHGGAKDGTSQLDTDPSNDEKKAQYRRRPSTSMELVMGTSSTCVPEELEEGLRRASSPDSRNEGLAALCLCGRWASPEKPQLSIVANE